MTLNSSQYSFKDLESFLSRLPEKTILKGSGKARFKMLTFALLGILLTIGAFVSYQKGSGSLNLVIVLAFISLFFIVFTKMKWNDGNINIIEFNHQNIKIKDINQVIPLEAISAYNYRHDDHDTLTLTLEKPLPELKLTSKLKGGVGGSVVITQNSDRQVIKIIVPYCFTMDGKPLSPEQCLNIVESYLSIPEIKRQMVMAH